MKQKGSTLVVALVILSIMTLVATFAMQNSGIQSRMVANSIHTAESYRAANNENNGQYRTYNNFDELSKLTVAKSVKGANLLNNVTQPDNTTLNASFEYMGECPTCLIGEELGADKEVLLFEFTADAKTGGAESNQTIGTAALAPKMNPT
ncbi:MAG: hypothetical protein H7A09_01855 [Oceanospirillaceae bacterium]|nr:hypothetical protein [Oceanospirillaceae bacterium]MCP5334569.1 hypothetical protein [Oceanospirillaceae bacterium]MCP5351397.1 hypothetical protein [Oceanospirillaceae bacterium]